MSLKFNIFLLLGDIRENKRIFKISSNSFRTRYTKKISKAKKTEDLNAL